MSETTRRSQQNDAPGTTAGVAGGNRNYRLTQTDVDAPRPPFQTGGRTTEE